MATRRYGEITVETSKEDKRLFPEADLRKIDVIDYYERIANLMLPHLEGRPVVLERFPDGIAEDGFYQKQAGQHFPDFIPRVEVALRGEARRQKLVRCEDVATLVYLANQGTISFHPWGSRIESLDQPDRIIVDLDPPEGGPFAAVRTAALRTRELFVALGLRPYVKLTGSKGVHVVAALDGEATFDAARGLAQDAAELLAERHPDALTTARRKDRRGERLYLDVARNAYGQTAVAPWSLRARPGAPVAAPVPWRDLEEGRVGPEHLTLKNVFRSLGQRSDPWRDLGVERGSVAGARERLRALRAA